MSDGRTLPLAGSQRHFAIIGTLTVLVVLIPLFAVRLPPLVDLQGHIGRYAIQTGLEDHPWLKQYFSFHWQIIGNLGADVLVELLSAFHDVETSVWIVVLLTQLLAASGLLVLCREIHGRITPYCVFALPLIYCWPFSHGFINFSLSMALALLGFTLWLRLTRTGRPRLRSWLFAPISLAIWLCHAFGWGFLGLLCVAESLVRAREEGRSWFEALWGTAWRCLPLATPLAPMLLWRRQASGDGGETHGWFHFDDKLNWLLSILRLDHPLADMVSAGVLFGIVYLGLRSRHVTRDRRMMTAAGLCLLAFVALPLRAFGSYYADMRLAPYMMMVALLALDDGKLPQRQRQWLMTAGVVFLAARIVLTTTTYVERERVLEAHLQALDAIPERARIATLVSVSCSDAWDLPWLVQIGGLATARKHAFANNQWAGGGVNLLSVHYPEAGRFAYDGSQKIEGDCSAERTAMREAFESVPANAFTHVWIVGPQPDKQLARDGFTRVWQGPNSAMFQKDSAH